MSFKLVVTNKVVGEMVIPAIKDVNLKAGYKITVDDAILNDVDVQRALAGGYLREDVAVAPVLPVVPIASSKKEAKAKIKKVESNPDLIIDLNEMNEKEPKTKISAWDIENQKLVGKDESAKLVRKQYNGVEQEVQTGEIDFTEKPKDEEIPDLSKSLKKKKGKKSLKSSIKQLDQASKEIVAEANKAPEIKETGDISFVDFEQEAAKIKNHPILGKKTTED